MIREVKREDLAACAALIRKSFRTVADEFGITAENAPRFTAFAVTEEGLAAQMDAGHRLMFLDEEDGGICGYCSLKFRDQGACALINLCVLPACRHRGIGSRLLRYAAGIAGKQGCTVMELSIVEENSVLRKWYERGIPYRYGEAGFLSVHLRSYEDLFVRRIRNGGKVSDADGRSGRRIAAAYVRMVRRTAEGRLCRHTDARAPVPCQSKHVFP